jgi:ornithine lipid ester-linked acyl 2-hydroxylase
MKFIWSEDEFPWLKPITDNYLLLRTYAISKRQHFVPYRQTQLYNNNGWWVLGIINQQTGFSRYNAIISPVLDKLPYKPYIASYSCLEPHTEIFPHVGITDDIIRFHLGLLCPEDCGISIANTNHYWQEGKWLIFNDRLEHSAWNRSNSDRIVLIIDFYKKDINVDC